MLENNTTNSYIEPIADVNLESLDKRVSDIEYKLDSILEALKNSVELRKNNATIIDNNFQLLNKKIENLTERIKTLHNDQTQGFDEVKMELVKIQKTTNYEELYANLKKVD